MTSELVRKGIHSGFKKTDYPCTQNILYYGFNKLLGYVMINEPLSLLDPIHSTNIERQSFVFWPTKTAFSSSQTNISVPWFK